MKLEIISREPAEKRYEIPLLFVHGTGHAAWCWDENFLPFFAERGFSSHALSLRGHGRSEGGNKLKWTSIADYVADVRRAASDFKREPAVIGHSLGGLVVQKYLECHKVPAAVLVAPCPTEGMFLSGLRIQLRNPWLMAKVAIKQDYAVMFSTPELARKFLFSEGADAAKIEAYSSKFGSESYRAAIEMIYNLPQPSRVNVPMLVVGGQKDELVAPAKIEKTARDFRAECKIFAGMAHDVMLEPRWHDAAAFIADWLASTIE